MKSTAVDRLSGSSDTVWMPWPVRPDFSGSVFFFPADGRNAADTLSLEYAVAQFVLFAFFILSEFERKRRKGLRNKRWGADESLYRQGKGACHCDWSPLCIDFDQQDHVITLFHVFLGMI